MKTILYAMQKYCRRLLRQATMAPHYLRESQQTSAGIKARTPRRPEIPAHRALFFGACVAGPSGVTYARVMPPSTTKSVPLTKLLSSLAKNTTACASSIA